MTEKKHDKEMQRLRNTVEDLLDKSDAVIGEINRRLLETSYLPPKESPQQKLEFWMSSSKDKIALGGKINGEILFSIIDDFGSSSRIVIENSLTIKKSTAYVDASCRMEFHTIVHGSLKGEVFKDLLLDGSYVTNLVEINDCLIIERVC